MNLKHKEELLMLRVSETQTKTKSVNFGMIDVKIPPKFSTQLGRWVKSGKLSQEEADLFVKGIYDRAARLDISLRQIPMAKLELNIPASADSLTTSYSYKRPGVKTGATEGGGSSISFLDWVDPELSLLDKLNLAKEKMFRDFRKYLKEAYANELSQKASAKKN